MIVVWCHMKISFLPSHKLLRHLKVKKNGSWYPTFDMFALAESDDTVQGSDNMESPAGRNHTYSVLEPCEEVSFSSTSEFKTSA
mmetsp:Transcript_15031/g.22619  ORF Transcript_15031/g.22619 Transcript_15031/m.22619 type:complete len:84 (+) Transcript_15031:2056-2307(+)